MLVFSQQLLPNLSLSGTESYSVCINCMMLVVHSMTLRFSESNRCTCEGWREVHVPVWMPSQATLQAGKPHCSDTQGLMFGYKRYHLRTRQTVKLSTKFVWYQLNAPVCVLHLWMFYPFNYLKAQFCTQLRMLCAVL